MEAMTHGPHGPWRRPHHTAPPHGPTALPRPHGDTPRPQKHKWIIKQMLSKFENRFGKCVKSAPPKRVVF